MRARVSRAFLLGVVVVGFVNLTPAVGAVEPSEVVIETIATGLDNPRGIDVAPNGAVFVAEAGRGGDGACLPAPGGPGEVCLGLSGAITKIARDGTQSRIVDGLPSMAHEDGSEAAGPEDVVWSKGFRLYAAIGAALDPEARETLGPDGELLGHFVSLRRLDRPGFPDLVEEESVQNPNGDEIDSNPTSALRDGADDFVIADAGANALWHFDRPSRTVTPLAVFPDRDVGGPFPVEAVPTSVVKGPDGAYYVGQLTGFPFIDGAANVWRVVPGEDPTVFAEGFTNILDIGFDSDGNLWVVEIAQDGLLNGPFGQLVKVAPDGTQTSVISEGLFAPSGLAIGNDDEIYVSVCGICAGDGEVVKVTYSD